MKKIFVTLIAVATIIGCDDKPEIPSINSSLLYIYPNPAREMAGISINDNPQTSVLKVFDPSGKIILDENVDEGNHFYQVRLTDKGAYHVVLETGSSVITQKLFKI